MNSILSLFRLSYIAKFVSLTRRDGLMEAWKRARFHVGMIISGRGHSEFRETGRANTPECAPAGFGLFWLQAAEANAFHFSTAPAVLQRRRRIAVIGDLNLPQCRKYRVEQTVDLWKCGNVDVEFAHYEDFPRSSAILQSATHVVFYRLLNNCHATNFLYEAHRLKLPVAYDIDDPLFSISAYATYGNARHFSPRLRAHFIEQAPKYAAMMNSCDIAIVSTPELAEQARRHTSRPVFLRRNFADSETLSAGAEAIAGRTRESGSSFTVVLASGSEGRQADFDTIAVQLEDFVCARPDRRMLILGRFPKSHLSLRLAAQTEVRAFTNYHDYLRNLGSADCAVVPLADDVFNRCKSGVRVIDAAAAGIPAIVSNIGDARTLIDPGKTGFVVDDGPQWKLAFENLASDTSNSREMGRRARSCLEKRWSAALREPIIEKHLIDWVLA